MRSLGNSAHLIRVAALYVALMVVLLIVRQILVPRDFGKYGHFRAGAIQDNRLHPVSFAGAPTCRECHTDEARQIASGQHERVRCEACHGPLAAHAEDPTAHAGHKPDPKTVCMRCHLANVAKPVAFPQVVPSEHAPEGAACSDCHVPHSPGMG
jgi:hypothetical protein